MNCPACESNTGSVLFEDSIECRCGHVITVTYCVCLECDFVWRLNDGEFMDGSLIDSDSLYKAVEDVVESAIKRVNTKPTIESLRESLHPCVRCGETAIETDKNVFMCTNCGFEWEVKDYVK